jgi:mRNA-degrading endonuclease RelE of RelBE toxin-antitoxin system
VTYEVHLNEAADRDLTKLRPTVQRKILQRLELLKRDPRPRSVYGKRVQARIPLAPRPVDGGVAAECEPVPVSRTASQNAMPLAGTLRGSWCLRMGNYRAAYEIDEGAKMVMVWAIDHRSRFYEEALRRRR